MIRNRVNRGNRCSIIPGRPSPLVCRVDDIRMSSLAAAGGSINAFFFIIIFRYGKQTP